MKDSVNIEHIKKRVEAISLLHPDISFSLTNEATGAMILQTKRSGNDMLKTFALLFGRPKASCMRPVSIVRDQLSVTGYIGVESNASASIQVI
jgi:DNA mismatch repair protein MLH3